LEKEMWSSRSSIEHPSTSTTSVQQVCDVCTGLHTHWYQHLHLLMLMI